MLVALRLLRKGISGRVVVGAGGGPFDREHGVCVAAWAHNGRAARGGCLGADGQMGEVGHRHRIGGVLIGGKLAPRDSGMSAGWFAYAVLAERDDGSADFDDGHHP